MFPKTNYAEGTKNYAKGMEFENFIERFLPKPHKKHATIEGIYFKKNVDFYLKNSEKQKVIIEAKSMGTVLRPYIYSLIARVALNFPETITICCINREKHHNGDRNALGELIKMFDFVILKDKLEEWLPLCLENKQPTDYDNFWLNYFKDGGKTTIKQVYYEPILNYLKYCKKRKLAQNAKKISKKFNLSYSTTKKIISDLVKQKKVSLKGHKIEFIGKNLYLANQEQLYEYIYNNKKFVKIKELNNFYRYSYAILSQHLAENKKLFLIIGWVIFQDRFENYLDELVQFKSVRRISKELGLNSSSMGITDLLEIYVIKGVLKRDENRWYCKIKTS